MPTIVKLKNSVTTTATPTSLVQGEVAVNITDKKVWVGNAASGVVQLVGPGSTDLAVADGGTGVSALTANNVILGNGTSPVNFVAPGTTGNVLTSNGTTWTSATPAGGGVSSVNSQTGAVVTTNLYSIGGIVCGRPSNTTNYTVNSTIAGSSLYAMDTYNYWSGGGYFVHGSATLVNTGSWRCVSPADGGGDGYAGMWVRYA